jgi:hypothetical protein
MIEHVYERWGGFDGYARAHLGLDAGFPERLRSSLLA